MSILIDDSSKELVVHCFNASFTELGSLTVRVACESTYPLPDFYFNIKFLCVILPSSPRSVRIIKQVLFANSVSVTTGWDPPTDNGGRDDLTYTVTISPPAQLSATVVTSTSVTVSAADYNEDYTVSVVATNCAGDSTAEEYSFRVSELVDVCGKSISVCLQSSVYTVN